MRIGNHNQAYEWYRFQRPSVTSNPEFKVTGLFDDECLRNGTRYEIQNSYNGILTGTYTTPHSGMLFGMILSDLEWLSEIFNDTKHRAASLWQLSFVWLLLCDN